MSPFFALLCLIADHTMSPVLILKTKLVLYARLDWACLIVGQKGYYQKMCKNSRVIFCERKSNISDTFG